jgi:hypothetical protein
MSLTNDKPKTAYSRRLTQWWVKWLSQELRSYKAFVQADKFVLQGTIQRQLPKSSLQYYD